MERPFRQDMFEKSAQCIESSGVKHALELGSGPGFLADYLLSRRSELTLTLLDFSRSMHELAAIRLQPHRQRVRFLNRDFKDANWTDGLGEFKCILTMQAVHELRHKRHAVKFHRAVRELLQAGGIYLVCDHYCGEGGMENDQLYMTVTEHVSSLEGAGFSARVLLKKGSLVLIEARK